MDVAVVDAAVKPRPKKNTGPVTFPTCKLIPLLRRMGTLQEWNTLRKTTRSKTLSNSQDTHRPFQHQMEFLWMLTKIFTNHTCSIRSRVMLDPPCGTMIILFMTWKANRSLLLCIPTEMIPPLHRQKNNSKHRLLSLHPPPWTRFHHHLHRLIQSNRRQLRTRGRPPRNQLLLPLQLRLAVFWEDLLASTWGTTRKRTSLHLEGMMLRVPKMNMVLKRKPIQGLTMPASFVSTPPLATRVLRVTVSVLHTWTTVP
mmetsp:Transcript_33057/g.79901  ORF Transcript_33057/g.79901 Transcript_33057/m.79901 type:complete len:255 (+) Transcript_33057:1493-2257(+)